MDLELYNSSFSESTKFYYINVTLVVYEKNIPCSVNKKAVYTFYGQHKYGFLGGTFVVLSTVGRL